MTRVSQGILGSDKLITVQSVFSSEHEFILGTERFITVQSIFPLMHQFCDKVITVQSVFSLVHEFYDKLLAVQSVFSQVHEFHVKGITAQSVFSLVVQFYDKHIYIYHSLFTIWYRTCTCTIQDVHGKIKKLKSTQIIDNFPYRLFRICIIIV